MINFKELFSGYEPLPFDEMALLSAEAKAKCATIVIDTEEIMKRVLGDEYIEPDKIYKDDDIPDFKDDDLSFDEETLLSKEAKEECETIVIDPEEFTKKVLSDDISNVKGVKKTLRVKYCDICKGKDWRKHIILMPIGCYNAIFYGDHLYIDLQDYYSDIIDTLIKIDVISDKQKLKEQISRQYLQDIVDTSIIIDKMEHKHMLLLLQQYLQDINNMPIVIDKKEHILQLLQQCMIKMINIISETTRKHKVYIPRQLNFDEMNRRLKWLFFREISHPQKRRNAIRKKNHK